MAKSRTRKAQLLELLKQVRTESGLRQIDLAKKLHQPQSFVSKYESGERRLDLLELDQVCRACGTTLLDLVKRFDGSGS
jgi:transcriptional regulator with XRE-family HTH domain